MPRLAPCSASRRPRWCLTEPFVWHPERPCIGSTCPATSSGSVTSCRSWQCGTTALFKILATLILPDEGTASVEGCDVLRDPGGVRRVLAPVIADDRSLYWRLSAYENLRLFAALHGVPSQMLNRRVAELLEIV